MSETDELDVYLVNCCYFCTLGMLIETPDD